MSEDHQFTIDPDGEGWLIECSCGWFAHGMTEAEALNHFAEHEESLACKPTP